MLACNHSAYVAGCPECERVVAATNSAICTATDDCVWRRDTVCTAVDDCVYRRVALGSPADPAAALMSDDHGLYDGIAWALPPPGRVLGRRVALGSPADPAAALMSDDHGLYDGIAWALPPPGRVLGRRVALGSPADAASLAVIRGLLADERVRRSLEHDAREWAAACDGHEYRAALHPEGSADRAAQDDRAREARQHRDLYRAVLSLHVVELVQQDQP